VENELAEADAQHYRSAPRRLKKLRKPAAGSDQATEVNELIADLRHGIRSRGAALALICGYLVELRGLEPLTPTLPGAGESCDQGVQLAFCGVGDVVGWPIVVTVVVKIVVNPVEPSGCRCGGQHVDG
jgi:hypothetical protein